MKSAGGGNRREATAQQGLPEGAAGAAAAVAAARNPDEQNKKKRTLAHAAHVRTTRGGARAYLRLLEVAADHFDELRDLLVGLGVLQVAEPAEDALEVDLDRLGRRALPRRPATAARRAAGVLHTAAKRSTTNGSQRVGAPFDATSELARKRFAGGSGYRSNWSPAPMCTFPNRPSSVLSYLRHMREWGGDPVTHP